MSVAQTESSPGRVQELEALVLRAQSELAATNERLADVISERENLRRAYRLLMEQFELLRRRIFIAKAERVDASQLEIEFDKTKQKLDELAQQLGADAAEPTADGDTDRGGDADAVGSRPSGKPPAKAKDKPKGRRNLAEADLPERRIEIRDEELEGKATFIGWETSYKLGYQRAEAVRVVLGGCQIFRVTDGAVRFTLRRDSVFEIDRELEQGLVPTEVASAPGLFRISDR